MLNRNPVAARDHTVHALARLIQSICANGTPISARRSIREELQRVASIDDDLDQHFAPAWDRALALQTGRL